MKYLLEGVAHSFQHSEDIADIVIAMENVKTKEIGKAGFYPSSIFKHPGNRPYDDRANPGVIHDWSRGRLTTKAVNDAVDKIASGNIVAAHFHGAISADICCEAVKRAERHPEKTQYDGAPALGRIGMPIFDIPHVEDGLAKYLEIAPKGLAQSRGLFAGGFSPIDLFRILLDEGEKNCAKLLRILDRPCMTGMIRYMEDGATIGWHIDSACWDLPNILEVQQIESQISIVGILSEADAGGETIICPTRLSSLQYDANRLAGDEAYAIDEGFLPPERIRLRGEIGDILLFESRYPHMVTKVSGQSRFTITGFIGVCRDGNRIFFS